MSILTKFDFQSSLNQREHRESLLLLVPEILKFELCQNIATQMVIIHACKDILYLHI